MSANARHWVEDIADKVEQHAASRAHRTITCASGISPSGSIHLGNLRELMTAHIVAEELVRRGHTVRHVHSWDDYDRLRKVPAGVPESFAEHIGRPLAEIPDPFGEHPSYADRHIALFTSALERLSIRPEYRRQSREYRSGTYRAGIKTAMDARLRIFDILAQYQTAQPTAEDGGARRGAYYPLKVYCGTCNRDTTTITRYDDGTQQGEASCALCHGATAFDLTRPTAAKLVWKVDWPMRWSHEGVDFEPGAEDPSTPRGGFTVGTQLVRDVYGGLAPHYAGYAFVGTAGTSKLSSSKGSVITPDDALRVLEPSILRWIYARRPPNNRIVIDFGSEVFRLYDEMDGLVNKAAAGKANPAEQRTLALSRETSAGPVAVTPLPVSFRLLSSVADITQGDTAQILRIVGAHVKPGVSRDELEPRLSCAIRWASEFQPETERTRIRAAFAADVYAGLGADVQRGVELLVKGLEQHWSVDGLTTLVYGVPKQLQGLPLDTPPTAELKQAQREFFRAIYQLLCGADTGPRLPTLMLSLGQERLRALLGKPA